MGLKNKMRRENRARISASYADGPHGEIAKMITPQLCIVLLKRLGGSVEVPIAELDDTGGVLMTLALRDGVFHFELEKKQ